MRRRRDERGAVALVTALVTSFVLIVVAAITVDLGMQRVARRDMQSLADVVALDLSRELDGRTVAVLTPLLPTLVERSVARNGDTIGDTPQVTVELGSVSTAGVFSPMTAGTPTAVRVRAATSIDFAFGVATRGDVSRAAVSTAQAGSCLKLGSYLATVNTDQSALLNPLLGGLLGSSLNLSAVSYTGLANANITLAELVDVGGLGVGTADQLLALQNVSVREFFLASARVLDAQGKNTEANLLRSISVAAGTPTIRLGDLINAAPGDTSALTAGFNVLSLVQGAALLSHQGSAVSIPNLSLGLPGLFTTSASLNVIQAPQVTCGPVGTEFSTAQVSLRLTTRIPAQTISVPALGTSVTIDAFDVSTSFDLGKAIATLTGITCSSAGVSSLQVALRSAVIGSINVAANARLRATFTVPLLGGSGLLGSLLTTILSTLGLGSLLSPPSIILDNLVSLSGGSSASTYTRNLTLPIPASYTTPVGSGSGGLIGAVYLTPVLSSTLTLRYRPLLSPSTVDRTILRTEGLFADVLNPIISQVLSTLVNPLVSLLQSRLLMPLTQLLGVQYGGADVWAVPTATCANPKLVG
ncbi:hypothetical protein ABFT23_15505 [Nocardioides sp. C4-1]|uniref:hypothetical protein n=1 Tax=Nocardioides sp. C4-1 TaxID=3151851 RepID=UPI00326595D0